MGATSAQHEGIAKYTDREARRVFEENRFDGLKTVNSCQAFAVSSQDDRANPHLLAVRTLEGD